ncbi:MAG: hypothetical protein ACTS2F_02775 [Thainema sp.]
METTSLVLLVGLTLIVGACIFFIVYSILKSFIRKAEARKRRAEMLRQQELEKIRLAEEARLRAIEEEQRRLEEYKRSPSGKVNAIAKSTSNVVKGVAGGTADAAKGVADGVAGVAGGVFTVAKFVGGIGMALGGEAIKNKLLGDQYTDVSSYRRKDGTFVRGHKRRKG